MTSRPVGSLPAPGEQLGAYEILAEIAHGGMAAVYLARKRFDVHGLGKLVAIKVLLPHLRDREFVAMFLDEARVAVSISHANVVQVLDVGEHDGWPYMVMEYLRGQPLDRLVRRAREWSEPDDGPVLLALAQAAAGLHAAHETVGDDGHSLGIVHRDVTPRNIHVGYDGCTKIVDFGIAASRGRMVATRPNVVKGTLRYVAPELVSRAHAVDRRADIWSFGVVAWEALTGRQLFGGDSDAATLWSVMEQEIPELRTCAPQISEALARPIMACLQRDPNRRPRDLREIEEPLARAAQLTGGATTGELAGVVSRLFSVERARDDERMQIAVAPRPRSGTEAEPTRVLRMLPPPATARRWRWRWVALAGGALVAAGAAVALAVGDGDRAVAAAPAAASGPPPATTVAPAPAASPAPAAPAAPAAPPATAAAAPAGAAVSPVSQPPAVAASGPTSEPAQPAPSRTTARSPVRRRAPAPRKPAPPAATPPSPATAAAAAPTRTEPAEPRTKPLLDNPYQ